MPLVTTERALWLAEHVLPLEPRLRAWLRRRPLFGLEVEDVVQETYAILAGLEAVSHIDRPSAYVFEVAKNVLRQAARRSRIVAFDALADIDDFDPPFDGPSPERAASDRQQLRSVAAAISALPGKCRHAFTLRKVEGLSQRETARRMGISENTVEKHVAKALRILMNSTADGGNHAGAASREREDAEQQESAPPRISRRH